MRMFPSVANVLGKLLIACFGLNGVSAGMLTNGTPRPWAETRLLGDQIREHAVEQFISAWQEEKTRTSADPHLWGDEVEYMLIEFESSGVSLSLRGLEFLDALQESSWHTWHPEYAGWQVESTPREPYEEVDLLAVERSMSQRRRELNSVLHGGEKALTLPSFPRLGCGGGLGIETHEPPPNLHGAQLLSEMVPDGCVTPHPRFWAHAVGIRERRAANPFIAVPAWLDHATPFRLAVQRAELARREGSASLLSSLPDDAIYMDATVFGGGACALQAQPRPHRLRRQLERRPRTSCRGGSPTAVASTGPPPRTKWTRRVPHPVLIGHAACQHVC